MPIDLRHLRCFLVLAEELHLSRAAERLQIGPSLLFCTIKELEEDLCTLLFLHNTRHTSLTRVGEIFLEHVAGVFTALDQARTSVQTASAGLHDQRCIALSDGGASARLASLTAGCRKGMPVIDVCLSDPLPRLIKQQDEERYGTAFAQSTDTGDGTFATQVRSDALHVVVPARHPLLAYERIPLAEVLRYPLVMGDLNVCEGYCSPVEHALPSLDQEPLIAERVESFDLMMAMVAAGFALALASAPQIAVSREAGIVARPLKESSLTLITYLLG